MSTPENRQLVAAFEQHGIGMERALLDELESVAQWGAARMRMAAPKFRSALTNSIRVDRPDPMTREIRPGMAYARAVEDGRRPGKGLPRFFDPASRDIVAWLEAHAFRGQRRPRPGSGRFTARELELRDRYMGLSRHVKYHGLQAHPFVRPVADQLEALFPARMAARAARFVGGGGSVA